nr:MAG TPA: hypothetical protein [Caudoviricetes sp.]
MLLNLALKARFLAPIFSIRAKKRLRLLQKTRVSVSQI